LMYNTDYFEESLQLHALKKGKLETVSKAPVRTEEDLSAAYLPGVTNPCMLLAQNPDDAYKYSIKSNTVLVVGDGSSVPGLGNIGGPASLPFMESIAILLKEYGGVDAFPICLDTQKADEIIETVIRIAPAFGAVCLEGVAAPKCFEVEKRLKEKLGIPVFHNGQHGFAIAAGAAVINAFRLLGKPLAKVRAVVCGAGAAGNATAKMLVLLGVRDIVVCDSKGIVSASRFSEFDEDKLELLEFSNKDGLNGGLEEALRDRDLCIGASKPRVLTERMISSMARDSVVFALAFPEPEILPDFAQNAGARIVGAGLPDFPNRIDSLLAFPGIFRGALDAGAPDITDAMKIAAAYAIAGQVSDKELYEEQIVPSVFKGGLAGKVAAAVAAAWVKEEK